MKEEQLLHSIKESLRNSAGWDGDEIARDRELALDYYHARASRFPAVAGRSAYVSEDVKAMVHANLAQMMDAFTSNNIVEFQSFGPEDEDQAQLESETVSYVVMELNNGFTELAQAISDALLLRNGFVKVWSEERRYPELERYSGVAPEALAELVNRPGTETKVLKYDPDTGELRLRVVYVVQRLRVASIAPENFFYLKDYDSHDLQDIPFCAERHVDRRSDLIELGFPKSKVKELKPYHATSNNIVHGARNVGGVNQVGERGVDESQDQIEWYECYMLYDSDGDGISERHRVCFSDETILSDEEVNLVPYATGAVFFNPHRLTGVSLWDNLRQTQDLMTGLRRAQFDAANTAMLNRVAVLDGAVNPDDLADGRTNGALRVKKTVQDVRAAVMPFTIPDLSGSILQNIQDLRHVRSEMGGAALDLASGQMQIGGDRMGSQGLDRAYSVMEQLAAMMTKNIAQTLIRNTFLLAHATLRENVREPLPIKRNGKWFSPVPAEWPRRSCIFVKVGMSPGERSRKMAALDKILQSQIGLAQMGMDNVLVTVDGFYKALMDWARVAEIPNPEQYFLDPLSPQARQAAQEKAQAAQAEAQEKRNLMHQAIQLEQLRTATEKYKADQATQFDYWAKTMDVEMKEAELAGKATIELVKQNRETANAEVSGSDGPNESSSDSDE